MHTFSISFLFFISFSTNFLQGVAGSKARFVRQLARLQPRQSTSDIPHSEPSYYPIKGIPVPSNETLPQRLEIRQLQRNAAQWDLYLLALRQLQVMDQEERTSYYQIAGIHGRPFIPWDNTRLGGQGQSDQYQGYCPHSSLLFPTWHRPYLALFEQVLYGIVQDIAADYKSRNASSYISAAKSFRAPYWDWAASPPNGEHVMPQSIWWGSTVQVYGPNGTENMVNPLYRYDFNPLWPNDLPNDPVWKWNHTMRAPTNYESNATSQDDLVNKELDAAQPSYGKRLLNLFQSYPTYDKFSTKAWMPNDNGSADSYDSMESLHDAVHALIGGYGGHFEYNEYSAFDPVFWLHHVQVDRIFSIWQNIYPDTYVSSTHANFSGSATITPGSMIDQDTALTPFHKDINGSFWTSAEVRDPSVFGYTYPETAEGHACATIKAVNKLYAKAVNTPPLNVTKIGESNDSFAHEMDKTAAHEKRTYYEWLTNIRVAQNAVSSTFNVMIFLGEFDHSKPQVWAQEPSFVGTYSVFLPINGMSGPSASGLVGGTVPLSDAINEKAKAAGCNVDDPDAVAAYLEKNLDWAVMKVSDTSEVPLDEMPSLVVSVAKCFVTAAEDECSFPDWSQCSAERQITRKKPAGLRKGGVA